MSGAYTPKQMGGEIGNETGAGRFDTLYAEAKSAMGYAANTLRALTERYREAYHEDLATWHADRDRLDALERGDATLPHAGPVDPPAPAPPSEPGSSPAGANEPGTRAAQLRRQVSVRTGELGDRTTELARLELAVKGLERTWLFLERGDASLLADPAQPVAADDFQMRIVEAREAERARLAQEVHDGPAQALSNAIFQAEYIDKVLDSDPRSVRAELRFLRDRLRRELGDVRAFISQLRPPLLDELGLRGSMEDTVETMRALTGATIETELLAPDDALADAEQVVVLRVLQEALQNVRKHADAHRVRVSTRLDGDTWILEVVDDGRGFDPDAVAARGRRNFGIQFMRERAELVRAHLEVRSRPAGGTAVWLAIPVGGREEVSLR